MLWFKLNLLLRRQRHAAAIGRRVAGQVANEEASTVGGDIGILQQHAQGRRLMMIGQSIQERHCHFARRKHLRRGDRSQRSR